MSITKLRNSPMTQVPSSYGGHENEEVQSPGTGSRRIAIEVTQAMAANLPALTFSCKHLCSQISCQGSTIFRPRTKKVNGAASPLSVRQRHNTSYRNTAMIVLVEPDGRIYVGNQTRYGERRKTRPIEITIKLKIWIFNSNPGFRRFCGMIAADGSS